MTGPIERLTALDAVEKDILTCIQSSGSLWSEFLIFSLCEYTAA